MNGFKGLGSKPLKISNAVPKQHRLPAVSSTTQATTTAATTTATTYSTAQDYSQYYDYSQSYWQNYSAWQGYYDTSADPTANSYMTPAADYSYSYTYNSVMQGADENGSPEDDLELVEHNVPVDVERLNRELIERDYNMWDALESSKWLPLEGLAI